MVYGAGSLVVARPLFLVLDDRTADPLHSAGRRMSDVMRRALLGATDFKIDV